MEEGETRQFLRPAKSLGWRNPDINLPRKQPHAGICTRQPEGRIVIVCLGVLVADLRCL